MDDKPPQDPISIPTALDSIFSEWRKMEKQLEKYRREQVKSMTKILNLQKKNSSLEQQNSFYRSKIDMLIDKCDRDSSKYIYASSLFFTNFLFFLLNPYPPINFILQIRENDVQKISEILKNTKLNEILDPESSIPPCSLSTINSSNGHEMGLNYVDSSTTRPPTSFNNGVPLSISTFGHLNKTLKKYIRNPKWSKLDTLFGDKDKIMSIDFAKNDASDLLTLVTGGEDGMVSVFKDGQAPLNKTSTSNMDVEFRLRGHMGCITTVVIDPISNRIYSAGVDNTLCIYNPLSSSSAIKNYYFASNILRDLHSDVIWDLDIYSYNKSNSSDSDNSAISLLSSASADGTCKVWDISSELPSLIGSYSSPHGN
ncbi:Striatin-4 [Smittium mucronatum]|uniref:Striatin-4 n=1 Tax=Smittium mucronatum TaxID=133383 RepID=A0A1R0H941_9FUNG|nr:Striatin-4 [Smittium mucronatum]